jgi:cell division septation protein DedD
MGIGKNKRTPNDKSASGTKWYKKFGWIIFFLIFFAPIGVFLMWKYNKNCNKFIKAIVTIISFFFFIVWIMPTDDSNGNKTSMVEEKIVDVSPTITTIPETTMVPEPTVTSVPTAIPEPTATPVPTATPKPTTTPVPTATPEPIATPEPTAAPEPTATPVEEMVWIPQTGSKYHSKASCSNMKDPRQVTLSEAQASGYEPCKRCH